MKKLKISILFIMAMVVLCAAPAQAEEKDITATVLWSCFVPGGGHFYLGQVNAGNAYLMTEGALLVAGMTAKESLADSEWNLFLANALKIHELNIFTSYREARIRNQNSGYINPIDTTTLPGLYLAPFKWENLSSPYVYGFLLAGVGINMLQASLNQQRRDYDSIDNVRMMGVYLDRPSATAAYAFSWITLDLNAAVSEECAYRGVLQAEAEESIGKTAGLLVSSSIFGLGHVTDWGSGASWLNGGVATLAGIYLGWVFQKEGYRLEKSIAAHFWFNMAAGATLFIMDPANNPLGLKINFRM
jgi:membrane protease YdiL (CAAX protease family)